MNKEDTRSSSITTLTELGRYVSVDDWVGFHRDRLLATLAQIKRGLDQDQIAKITGLDAPHVNHLLDALSTPPPLVFCSDPEQGKAAAWRLTEQGQRWIEESPCRPGRPGDPR